jgi:hypothetical protein
MGVLHTIKRGKDNWIGYILCKNCLLKQVIRRKIERRRERRCKQLLDDLKGSRDCCKLKRKALDRNLWRIHFGKGLDLS